MMQLLVILALAGAIFGSVSGGYWEGNEGIVLGGSSGLILGVFVWFLTGSVRYAVHEYRLNRYFNQDGNSHDTN